MRAWRRVHLWAHVPRGEQPDGAPPRGVLDDRAGDVLCRPQGRHGQCGTYSMPCFLFLDSFRLLRLFDCVVKYEVSRVWAAGTTGSRF